MGAGMSEQNGTGTRKAGGVNRIRKAAPMVEIGGTGLKQFGGIIQEEFHRQLQGDKALEVYTEMINNSPTIGGVLFMIEMHARKVPWHVQPGGETAQDLDAAQFIEECRQDMSMSWEDTLSEILTMIAYGWSYHECVYKLRTGGDPLTPGTFSRYTDGKIGWRKLPIRAQVTRWKWEIEPNGGIQGMWQLPRTGKQPVFIPIQKALLFRPRVHKNSPEGRSALRTAYKSYYYHSRIQEIEAIGIERDLEGFPMAKIPAKEIQGNTAVYQAWKLAMRNIRRNEQESLIIPSDVDSETNLPYYSVELLTSGSRRQFDINTTLERLDRRMALTLLADFLFLGQTGVGSHAQTRTRASLFATALDAWLDQIADVFNRHAIPRLLALNGMAVDAPPYLEHEPTETPDPNLLADAISKLTAAGMPIFPDPKLENTVRNFMGLPEMNEDEIEERETLDEEQAALDMEMQQAALEGQVVAANAGKEQAMAERDQAQKALETAERMQKALAPSTPLHVHLPETLKLEQVPPVVHVAAPVIHNTVNVPQQAAPQVVVKPTIKAPDVTVHVDKGAPPVVQVTVPERKPRKRRTKLLKDPKTGDVVGSETTEE